MAERHRGSFSMIRQRTLKNFIRATGVGLHSGEQIRLTLRPAPPDTGIVFRRTDLAPPRDIRASLDNLGAPASATVLAGQDAEVAAVEHMLAAFAGLGVDNACVELDAPEVPVMDGSAAPFVFLIQSAGIREQEAPKRFLRVRRAVQVTEAGSWARLEPYDGFRVSCTLDLGHPAFPGRPQEASIDFASASFVKEISRARNFSFLGRDAAHPARGASENNTVLVAAEGVLNEDGLRYRNEFVKHTMLDAVGDLYLLGKGLIGAYSACNPGHLINHRLLQRLWETPESWETVTFEDDAAAREILHRAVG